jgi:signal transduction histidine kinase
LMLLTAVIAERRHIENSLSEVAQKLIGAQEEEREKIARELHDDIGQQLAFVQIELEELKHEINDTQKANVTELSETVAEISRSARNLSHELHPASLEHLGLETALRKLCEGVSHKKSIHVHFLAKGLRPPTPENVSLCLYRVAQEALQNVIRHSGATEIWINVSQTAASLDLCIADNGRGFENNELRHSGLGLISMRERLRTVHGELRIVSSAGSGTTLMVSIPVSQ